MRVVGSACSAKRSLKLRQLSCEGTTAEMGPSLGADAKQNQK